MEPRRIAETLQAHGVRATQQRVAVYESLLLHPIHPTADMIFTALLPRYPTFSRTTIYNTLHTLTGAGLIREVNIDPQEQRFDGNPAVPVGSCSILNWMTSSSAAFVPPDFLPTCVTSFWSGLVRPAAASRLDYLFCRLWF